MNAYLLTAAVLAILLGAIHSVMGEVLIFRRWRANTATLTAAGLLLRHVGILWASWHIVTVFGWGIGAVLYRLWLADCPSTECPGRVFAQLPTFIVTALAVSTLAASVLVLVGTRGRHPGWIVLLLIAALCWLA